MSEGTALPADDPRVRATVLAIADELTEDGLVLRYRTEETDDGLSGVEGTFTICSFWLVRALYVTGRRDEAMALFDDLIACRNHVGLLSEDLDFDTRRQLGNFPQAYSHLALIDVVELITQRRFWSKFIQA